MAKKTLSCKYNQECWLKYRLPKIRAAAKNGYKIYLPYQCSYVAMGDMEKCSLRDGFVEREQLGKTEIAEGVEVINGNTDNPVGV